MNWSGEWPVCTNSAAWPQTWLSASASKLEHAIVPSLESAADALHVTSRTLRRRLQTEALSYRQILTAVRIELEPYYELQGLNRESIASRLG